MTIIRGSRQGSLIRRLVTVTAVLFLAFGVTLSMVQAENQSRSLYGALETTARNNGALLAPSFVNGLLRGDVTGIRQSVEAIARQKGVVDVFVLDDTHSTLFRSGRRSSGPLGGAVRADAVATQQAVILRHGQVLDSVSPLFAGHTRVGTLVIGYDLARVQAEVRDNRENTLIVGLVFSLVAGLITWLLLRRIARGLAILTTAAQIAADEQLPALVRALRQGTDPTVQAPRSLEVVSDDEIGRLSSAFNSYRSVVVDMATKLSAAASSSEARLQRAFESSPIGMAFVGSDACLVEVNRALCVMLGREPGDILGRPLSSFSPDRGRTRTEALAEVDGSDRATRRFLRPDGSTVWALQASTSVPLQGDATAPLLIQFVDTTKQRQSEQKLSHLAFHDPLTGLANRALMHDRLSHALAARSPSRLSLLMLDLDDFKMVNDISGHAAGDRLLVEVAERLKACVRPGDTVARPGGDEFTILIEDSAEAETVARRVLERLAAPMTLEGRVVTPLASIGIAHNDPPGLSADDLVRRADVAMYAAKAAGRARFEFFHESMAEALVARADLETALSEAVENDEIEVHYQPIIGVDALRMVQVEALARWQRPGGLVPPMDFIPVAEQSGLILAIGQEVLSKACRQMCRWLLDGPDRTLAVNVSAAQLAQPTFTQDVLAALAQTGLEPRHLVLEVTETLFLEADPAGVRRLSDLRGQGIKVSIDDFGTGYSSLGRLQLLPVDSVKIDKLFVSEIRTGQEDLAILTSMVAMAHNLGLDVTAEGVETAEQATRLIDLGCDYLQGYHFSRPKRASELADQGWLDGGGTIPPGLTQRGRGGASATVVLLDAASESPGRRTAQVGLTADGFAVHEAASIHQVHELAGELRVDCVLIDATLPGTNPADLVRQLRRDIAISSSAVVVLAGTDARESRLDTFAAGADDYIFKPVAMHHLAERLRAAVAAAGADTHSQPKTARPHGDATHPGSETETTRPALDAVV